MPPEADPAWVPARVLPPGERKLAIAGVASRMRMFDPCSGALLGAGEAEVMDAARVRELVSKARAAQPQWAALSYAQRGTVLRVLNDYITRHQAAICHVAARDTGKTSAGP